MKDVVKQIVQNYRSQIMDGAIYFAPHIPPKKLKNVLRTYAKGAEAEEVLFLFDNTILGSAKDGALVTAEAIYVHNILESAQKIALKEIREVFADRRKFLTINGARFLSAEIIQFETLKKIEEVFQKIIEYYQTGTLENIVFVQPPGREASEREWDDIQKLRRKGASLIEFWQFIFQSTIHQKAWTRFSSTGAIDRILWKFLMEPSQLPFLETWETQHPESEATLHLWWRLLQTLPPTKKYEAISIFLDSLLPSRAQTVLRLLRQQTPRQNLLFIAPNIPREKKEHAIEGMNIPEHETILGLLDLTTFGSAKNGIVFAQNAIYYQNPWYGRSPGRGVVQYQELPQRQLRVEPRDLYMDFGQFIECGVVYSSNDFYTLSDGIRQWIQESEISEDLSSKVQILIQLLQHSSKGLRILACFALSQGYEKNVDPEILDALQHTLADSEREVRIAAAIGLARLWKEQISEALKGSTIQEESQKFPDISYLWNHLQITPALFNHFQFFRNRMNGWAEFEIINLSNREIILWLEEQGTEYVITSGSIYLLGLRPHPVNPFYPKGCFYLDPEGPLFFPDASAFDPLFLVWDEARRRLNCVTENYTLISYRTASVIH